VISDFFLNAKRSALVGCDLGVGVNTEAAEFNAIKLHVLELMERRMEIENRFLVKDEGPAADRKFLAHVVVTLVEIGENCR